MIPTMVVLGVVIGLLPRPWYPALVIVAGMFWTALLGVNGTIDPGSGFEMLGAFLAGTINAYIGAVIIRIILPTIRGSIGDRWRQ